MIIESITRWHSLQWNAQKKNACILPDITTSRPAYLGRNLEFTKNQAKFFKQPPYFIFQPSIDVNI